MKSRKEELICEQEGTHHGQQARSEVSSARRHKVEE